MTEAIKFDQEAYQAAGRKIKHCMAPGCGKEFVAKPNQKICSPECSVRRRNALQRDRYYNNQKFNIISERNSLLCRMPMPSK